MSLERARVRVAAGQVTEMSWQTWDVVGVPAYGDVLPFYVVWFNTDAKRYQCACRETQLVERLCEHVVAVALYRNQAGDHYVGGTDNPDHIPDHLHNDIAVIGNADALPSDSFPSLPKPADMEWGGPPLPEWVSEFRQHQWDAAISVVEAFKAGARVVFLDAPTGSGKTLIAEMVRRIMGTRALYVCSDKALQDQFASDFDYASVLKGRSNYPTLSQTANEQGITAGDCDKRMDSTRDERVCTYCGTRTYDCPYEIAKREALANELAVLNTTYYLTEVNNVGRFRPERVKEGDDPRRRDLIVVDECDLLETELMRFIEFYVGEGALRRLGLTAPKKGSHHKTIADWLVDDFASACYMAANRIDKSTTDMRERKRKQTLTRMYDDAMVTARELNEAGESDERVLWVRDNDAGPLSLRPVRVDRQTPRYLWEHAEHWLCMSATVISGDVEAASLGLDAAGIPWTVVSVPMTFPKEHRPIYAAPCADMSYKGKQAGSWDECVTAIRGILRRHPGERVLIHAVSYALAGHLAEQLVGSDRHIYTYANASERTGVLHDFRRMAGSVLIAPSMERGVDLKGDDCRVVIVAKTPYPNISDKAIGARMHQGREGDVWYAVQTIRSLIQMTGRAVRSEDDWAATYIVDSQFLTNLHSKWKHLLPGWWKDAMEIVNARALLREGQA